MRIIKFRGKTPDGIWVYGQYAGEFDNSNVGGFRGALILAPYATIVEPLTVGQFTGVTDKYGNKIYEGDIIEIEEIGGYGCKRKGVVEYDVEECAFVVRLLPPSWAGTVRLSTKVQICSDMNSACEYINQYEVIGNIHDNPELLKGGIK